ncbi:MAG: hypothetical protein M1823_004932 [Watsoniomyces obsoletus]|nr:MAG: hypothetical protein M1823_004932 [Watsoniomyces obsoletus]
MERLPREIFDEILSNADFPSLKNTRLVCKSFAALAAAHIFQDVHVLILPESLNKLDNICQSEYLRGHVHHIYCWEPLFQEPEHSIHTEAAYYDWLMKNELYYDRLIAGEMHGGMDEPNERDVRLARDHYIRYREQEKEMRDGGRYHRSLVQAIRSCQRLRSVVIPWELRSLPQTQAVIRESPTLQGIYSDTLLPISYLQLQEDTLPLRKQFFEQVFGFFSATNSVISKITLSDNTYFSTAAWPYYFDSSDVDPPGYEDPDEEHLAVCHRMFFETEAQQDTRMTRRRSRIPARTLSTGDQPVATSPPNRSSLTTYQRAEKGTLHLYSIDDPLMYALGVTAEKHLVQQLMRDDGWPKGFRRMDLRGISITEEDLIALLRHHSQTLEEIYGIDLLVTGGGRWSTIFEVLRREVPHLRSVQFEDIDDDQWVWGDRSPPAPMLAEVDDLLNAYVRGDRNTEWTGLLSDFFDQPMEVTLRRYPEYERMVNANRPSWWPRLEDNNG